MKTLMEFIYHWHAAFQESIPSIVVVLVASKEEAIKVHARYQ